VIEPFEKSSVTIHRRRFLKSATAVAGGALLPGIAWATAERCHDLRCVNGKNYITPVKDQDDPAPCNACTAFAVVAMVEGTYNKSQPQPVAGLDLDEMKLFNANTTPPSGGCATSHWWPKYALQVCKDNGLYWENPPTQQPLKIGHFESLLRPSLNLTQNAMKDWIVNTGPVIAVMVQYEDFYSWGKVWSEQNPGVRNVQVYEPGVELDLCPSATPSPLCQCQPVASTGSGSTPTGSSDLSYAKRTMTPARKRTVGPIIGGHVVCIVGFDSASWICKNSWGNAWNGDGYVLIAQGKASAANIPKCYIDEIDVYGVSFQP
jgi:hypothetical protein